MALFKGLARLKFLRDTAFDIFGFTDERRMERALIGEYEALLERIAARLDSQNYQAAIELANAASAIRGFGHVKAQTHAMASEEAQRLLAVFEASAGATPDMPDRRAVQAR